jgi:DNA-binding NarL/FixJ family response regulator
MGAGHGPLTRREQEVADLIVNGATDREIAGVLVISQQTAHTHVRNILSKLGLQSRVQVAAWVVQAGQIGHPARTATKDT